MLSFKKIGPATLALLMLSLSAGAVLADDTAKPAAGASKETQQQPKQSPTDTVKRVNGTPITRQELDRAVKVMLAQSKAEQPLPPEQMKQAEGAALEQLIAAELLYQEAAKLGMKDLDKQVQEKMTQNRAKFSSEEDYQKALQGVDMTQKDMQDFTRKDLLINNFIEKRFVAKAKISDEEAHSFYDANVEKYFKKPETARASHILIGVDEKASAEDHKKAKEKAEAILTRVKKGEDFAALAKAESSCPSSAQGGDLGNFTPGQMVAPFDKAAFALKPGEISGVVETQFGYHIIKLTEKHAAATESFDNAKPKIVEYLKREKVQKELVAFIADLNKSAHLEDK